MKTYYVYVLRCIDGTFYTGVTNDVDRRVGEHHDGRDRFCYTYMRRPLRLVHVSEFAWIDQAIAFEKQFKGWSHRKKRCFVEGNWDDLRRFAKGSRRGRSSFDSGAARLRSG